MKRRVMLLCVAALLAGCAAPQDRPWGLVHTARAPAPTDFASLLAGAKARPVQTDWVALRAAYAASPQYDPAMGQGPEVQAAVAAAAAGHWVDSDMAAQRALQANWMDLRAHLLAAQAKAQFQGPNPNDPDWLAAQGMLGAIRASGTGQSPRRAFHVLATSEEQALLDANHARAIGQSLLRKGDHSYDVLMVADTQTGDEGQVYFNIDQVLSRPMPLSTPHGVVLQ